MKKYTFLILLSLLSFNEIYANHTKGGWMYYEYLGPGIADPSKLRYKIGLNLYIDCGSSLIEPTWNFSFFGGRAPYTFIQDITVNVSPNYSIDGCATQICYPCINNIPPRCYKIVNYEIITELAPSTDGYIISKQRCCRITGISNIAGASQNYGATFTIKIPGTNAAPTAPLNTSPKFIFNDTAVVCGNNPFSINFNATDLDGDSLAYSFVDAYHGGDNGANSNPATSAPPPYTTIPYQAPYTGTSPLGAGATINPITGVISGIAPPPGEYVVCVLVKEYRNGIYIAESRKELHLKTASCTPLRANPNFDPVTCDGFTVTFTDNSTGGPTNFLWNFGDPASGAANTSALPTPTHTFTAAGTFNIKLVVSISGQCIDSITKPINVFPGFFPGFITNPTLCVGQPIQFTDTSRTAYGVVDSWRWDFGDLATLADTSHNQNPSYTYVPAGTYNVELIVTNSKGCKKTITKPITIFDPPVVDVFPADTIYCGLDTLQLNASGTGNFNWTPAINIIGANTASPLVFPTVATKYYATLTNGAGCSSKDSITVTPKLNLTAAAIANPAIICEEDTLQLSGSSNYAPNVSWQWSPAASVEFPNQQNTRAYPIANTTYTLTTTWGTHCTATATKNIMVHPLAIPNAGPDVAICGGQQSIQLNASGGTIYQWSPTTGLSNPNIANPVASPTSTTVYTVAVGFNTCAKMRLDSVIVNVRALPALTTLNDTLICNIDTLQLTTTGTGNFTWSPNYNISNTAVASPLVSPDVPTAYYVKLSDAFGCFSQDTVFVDVKDHVTLFAGNDTTICRTDGFFLNTVSDALHYKWTPATYLNYDTVKTPFTKPLTTTTYHVVANIGKCQSQDDVTITSIPYPAANGGADTSLCPGFGTQLHASGGSSYLWTPTTYLSDRTSANPFVSSPAASIRYIVTVTDTLGCPKPVKDTVWVFVYPKVVANAGPRDTSAVLGEPIVLHATGGASYLWSPATWLNNPTIQNPVALPQDNIRYILTAISQGNCIGTDTIDIKLFKIEPDMLVPTAFTPNGDGNNDIFRPILIGMKELKYFKVFNRFGQLLYSTSDIGKGWDGTFAGKGQDPATYVWVAEGVTFKGDTKFKKGYVVLIRQ